MNCLKCTKAACIDFACGNGDKRSIVIPTTGYDNLDQYHQALTMRLLSGLEPAIVAKKYAEARSKVEQEAKDARSSEEDMLHRRLEESDRLAEFVKTVQPKLKLYMFDDTHVWVGYPEAVETTGRKAYISMASRTKPGVVQLYNDDRSLTRLKTPSVRKEIVPRCHEPDPFGLYVCTYDIEDHADADAVIGHLATHFGKTITTRAASVAHGVATTAFEIARSAASLATQAATQVGRRAIDRAHEIHYSDKCRDWEKQYYHEFKTMTTEKQKELADNLLKKCNFNIKDDLMRRRNSDPAIHIPAFHTLNST